MSVNSIIRIVAGFFVMLSLGLGVQGSPIFQTPHWLWFTGFVGFNLFQSGFTKICPLESVLKRLGVKSTC